MAKPNFPEKQTAPSPWGTLEELLLAFAVARHGSDDWDAVAAELRNRSSAALHLLLAPHACKQKFHDLRRRFARNGVVSPPPPPQQSDDASSIPFLDELRRLRVAELRREVERYDLSIVSLETKVERLKEEREQSLRESGGERAEKLDLEERRSSEIGKSPEEFAGKEVSGEGSVHDKPASDESESADPKNSGEKPAVEERVAAGEKSSPAPVVEDSYGGSSDTVAAKKAESAEDGGERVGGGDSAESKGGRVEEEEGEAKEVCSSTSLTRKKEEEADGSEDGKRAHSGDVESQSLVGFLEILRSHKSGSLFERRREIQETPSYSNMIRQHIDFEIIRIRLEEGWYSGSKIKFFRDLMLILNNAIVFFGKKTLESMAAMELRSLLLKEMAAQSIATATKTKKNLVQKEETSMPDSNPEQQTSDMRKPKISVPMSACRKRSSIAARAASTSSSGGPERKKEQITILEKPAIGWKQSDKSSEKASEEQLPADAKKGRKDRPNKANTRSNSSKSSTGRSNGDNNKNSGGNGNGNANPGPSTRGGGGGGGGNENSASKSEKKESGNGNGNGGNASGKKKSATNFLNRMKRGSPLVEKSKGSGSNKGAVSENKKDNGGKQKEQVTPPPRRASGGKQAKEPESPAKRSVGRPLKRTAPSGPASAAPPAKRSRQSSETEVVASSRNAKKRSRK